MVDDFQDVSSRPLNIKEITDSYRLSELSFVPMLSLKKSPDCSRRARPRASAVPMDRTKPVQPVGSNASPDRDRVNDVASMS